MNEDIKRLNFGSVPKVIKSLVNQILRKIILLDLKHLLIQAHSALEFLRDIYNAFVGKSLVIHPN